MLQAELKSEKIKNTKLGQLFTARCQQAFSQGYGAGKADGRTQGSNEGYTAGFAAGYPAGLNAGRAAGHQLAYDGGFSAGYKHGVQAGMQQEIECTHRRSNAYVYYWQFAPAVIDLRLMGIQELPLASRRMQLLQQMIKDCKGQDMALIWTSVSGVLLRAWLLAGLTRAELKTLYKSLALKCHPDKKGCKEVFTALAWVRNNVLKLDEDMANVQQPNTQPAAAAAAAPGDAGFNFPPAII